MNYYFFSSALENFIRYFNYYSVFKKKLIFKFKFINSNIFHSFQLLLLLQLLKIIISIIKNLAHCFKQQQLISTF